MKHVYKLGRLTTNASLPGGTTATPETYVDRGQLVRGHSPIRLPYGAEGRAEILRQHLKDGYSLDTLAFYHGVPAELIQEWKDQAMENLSEALRNTA